MAARMQRDGEPRQIELLVDTDAGLPLVRLEVTEVVQRWSRTRFAEDCWRNERVLVLHLQFGQITADRPKVFRNNVFQWFQRHTA
ncbi:hypothetical protein D3C81_777300 [compost metagenome]